MIRMLEAAGPQIFLVRFFLSNKEENLILFCI